MIDRKMYDPLFNGYVKINFSSIKEYKDNTNIEYLTQTITNHRSLKVIHRDSGDLIPIKNGSIVYIEGIVDMQYYKDKQSGKWVEKGLYINLSGFKVLSEVEVETMRLQYEIERNNMKQRGGII